MPNPVPTSAAQYDRATEQIRGIVLALEVTDQRYYLLSMGLVAIAHAILFVGTVIREKR